MAEAGHLQSGARRGQFKPNSDFDQQSQRGMLMQEVFENGPIDRAVKGYPKLIARRPTYSPIQRIEPVRLDQNAGMEPRQLIVQLDAATVCRKIDDLPEVADTGFHANLDKPRCRRSQSLSRLHVGPVPDEIKPFVKSPLARDWTGEHPGRDESLSALQAC